MRFAGGLHQAMLAGFQDVARIALMYICANFAHTGMPCIAAAWLQGAQVLPFG